MTEGELPKGKEKEQPSSADMEGDVATAHPASGRKKELRAHCEAFKSRVSKSGAADMLAKLCVTLYHDSR